METAFIIIIERRDYGGVLSEDCEDTEQSFEKVLKVRETVLRTRNCQTCMVNILSQGSQPRQPRQRESICFFIYPAIHYATFNPLQYDLYCDTNGGI